MGEPWDRELLDHFFYEPNTELMKVYYLKKKTQTKSKPKEGSSKM